MFRKVFRRLTKTKDATVKKPEPSKPSAPSAKILTAEGWKRLMMKKYRK